MFRILLFMAFVTNVSTGAMVTVIALGGLLVMIGALSRRQFPLIDSGLAKAVLVYLGVWLICAIGAREQMMSIHAVFGTSYRFLPLFFVLLYVQTKEQVRSFVLVFAISVCINDLTALWQMAAHGSISWRPMGLVHSPTFLGSHMLMAIPVLFFFSRKDYFRSREQIFLLGMALFSLLILILTQTRGAWIAFVLVMIAYVIFERRFRRQLLLGGLVGLVCIVGGLLLSHSYSQRLATLADPQMQSNLERAYMWHGAISIWRDHPVTGVGMDEYGWYYNTIYILPEAKAQFLNVDRPDTWHGHPHNNILKHLSEGGVLGLAAYFVLHGYIFLRLWRQYKKERYTAAFSCALMGILVFLGVHFEGLTDTNINQLSILTEYCLLMGISLRAGVLEEG
jgi:hypothetical protein